MKPPWEHMGCVMKRKREYKATNSLLTPNYTFIYALDFLSEQT